MQKQEENVCLFLMLLFTKCIILVYYNILLYLLLQYVHFTGSTFFFHRSHHIIEKRLSEMLKM